QPEPAAFERAAHEEMPSAPGGHWEREQARLLLSRRGIPRQGAHRTPQENPPARSIRNACPDAEVGPCLTSVYTRAAVGVLSRATAAPGTHTGWNQASARKQLVHCAKPLTRSYRPTHAVKMALRSEDIKAGRTLDYLDALVEGMSARAVPFLQYLLREM